MQRCGGWRMLVSGSVLRPRLAMLERTLADWCVLNTIGLYDDDPRGVHVPRAVDALLRSEARHELLAAERTTEQKLLVERHTSRLLRLRRRWKRPAEQERLRRLRAFRNAYLAHHDLNPRRVDGPLRRDLDSLYVYSANVVLTAQMILGGARTNHAAGRASLIRNSQAFLNAQVIAARHLPRLADEEPWPPLYPPC